MDLYTLADLPKLPTDLEQLKLSPYDEGTPIPLTDDALEPLPALPQLRALDLNHAGGLTAAGYRRLAERAPEIRVLRHWAAKGLGKGLAKALGALERLRELELNSAVDLTRADLKALAQLPLERLLVTGGLKLKGGSLKALEAAKGLAELSVRGQPITAADIEALAALPKLETLRLHPGHNFKKFKRFDIKDGLLEGLAAAPALRRLDPGRALTRGEAEALAGAPNLEQLIVWIRDLDQLRGLEALGSSGKTLIIAFESIDAVTDELLEAIPQVLPSAAALTLDQGGVVNRGKNFTAVGVAHLGGLTQLRRLGIRGGWTFKNPDMAFLKGLTQLESLDLHHLYKLTAGVTAHLKPLTKLRHLNLAGIKLSDAAPKKLVGLPLESLYIDAGKIADKGLAAIGQIPTLRRLGFRYLVGGATDVGLEALSKLEALEALNIKIATMTRAGFEALARLPKLRGLQLHVDPNTQLEDDWLEPIASMPALETLGFDHGGIDGLTDAALGRFAACEALRRVDIPKRGYVGEFSAEAVAAYEASGGPLLTLDGNDLFYVEACPKATDWLD